MALCIIQIIYRAQMSFRHCHTNGHSQALVWRAGGHFNAVGNSALGMSGCARIPLPKTPQIVECDSVPGQEETE